MDTERRCLLIEYALDQWGFGSQTIDHFDLWDQLENEVKALEETQPDYVKVLKEKQGINARTN